MSRVISKTSYLGDFCSRKTDKIFWGSGEDQHEDLTRLGDSRIPATPQTQPQVPRATDHFQFKGVPVLAGALSEASESSTVGDASALEQASLQSLSVSCTPTPSGTYCKVVLESESQTSVRDFIAMYNRLKKKTPGFPESCTKKGLVCRIAHNVEEVCGIVGRNGFYKNSAFGPKSGLKISIPRRTSARWWRRRSLLLSR
ncbi:uncharacterized protein M437DRAFT_66508 [Aureobasidium melanogenum CBS 110374]|uniref:Uncharacterized protein n=1 Tax=Aureobasidium melanogenum (strain CBS 110374) TaxID=1043003 RepID=A0A074VNF3_AURM1|nr:uncharacterized protein M437DRAFT_66508 [Aureobasidium melanogenum CBS 110374]KEQ62053.1 hypothetical protein M437DRAFT_66508 [Aureobasidium melanogenum CBS 110374]